MVRLKAQSVLNQYGDLSIISIPIWFD